MEKVHNPFTPEALEELRSRIGKPLPSRHEPFNNIATQDAIRHFAHGYGDTNPLWTDPEYGKRTKYGCLVAPPTFLYSCRRFPTPTQSMGLPGAHGLNSGEDWYWYRTLKVGDTIRDEEMLESLEEVHGRFTSPMYQQIGCGSYYNQHGELIAKGVRKSYRFARNPGSERDRYKDITRKTYSPEEIEAIKADYKKEQIRGATPRYWDDVKVGDELPQIVKGPLTVTDLIAWKIGWGFYPYTRAFGMRFAYIEKHPSASVTNPYGIPDAPERVHWEDELAQQLGVPFAYDFGPQRVTCLAQVITNWMGDDGFLKSLKSQIKRPCHVGDTTWYRGKVLRKSTADGEHLIECELWCVDQRDRQTARATATVSLPKRPS